MKSTDLGTVQPTLQRVAVVGAGYAGMAAAMELAEAGIPVSVFEAGPLPGGRARRIPGGDGSDDNGQHLLIGAYTTLLELLERMGIPLDEVFCRTPLRWWIEGGLRLQAPILPSPWHLAVGLLTARGVPLAERIATVRMLESLQAGGFCAQPGETVAALLDRQGAQGVLRKALWESLCVAALNTPAERACAQVFLNMLHDIATGPRSHSDLLIPRTDLSSLFPEPAAEYVRARGGHVYLQSPVLRIEDAGGAIRVVGSERHGLYQRVILAVPPRSLSRLIGHWPDMQPLLATATGLKFERIATLTLEYAQSLRLPRPMMGVADGSLDWLFDRHWLLHGTSTVGGRISGVLSAPGLERSLDRDTLTTMAHLDIERIVGRQAPPIHSRLVLEKFATISCQPGIERPDEITHDPRVLLAGDYLASRYPATLETAVRSGRRAAAAVIHWSHTMPMQQRMPHPRRLP